VVVDPAAAGHEHDGAAYSGENRDQGPKLDAFERQATPQIFNSSLKKDGGEGGGA